MQLYLFVCTVTLSSTLSEAFFFFPEKTEPIFLCLKVCPLYCSPRRHDEDASSLIYIDDDSPFFSSPPYFYEDHGSIHTPYHSGHYVYCKPKTTTTTPKPTTTTMATTTEEPTWICMVCMKKCNVVKKNR